jgi:hypothetical protein
LVAVEGSVHICEDGITDQCFCPGGSVCNFGADVDFFPDGTCCYFTFDDANDPNSIPALLKAAIAPHDAIADRVLEQVPGERRTLEAWPDVEEIELGLFSPPRQALVYRRAREQILVPALRRLDLVPAP